MLITNLSVDMASMALDCCLQSGPENINPGDPKRFVDLNYDYLDDTYTDYNTLVRQGQINHLPEEKNIPMRQRPYHTDLNYIKHNHPLTILVSHTSYICDSYYLCFATLVKRCCMLIFNLLVFLP